MSAIEQRLDRIEAQLAITDLVHRYAQLIRHDRPDEAAALFIEEGVFEIRDGHPDRPEHSIRSRLDGRARIHAYLAPGKGKPHPIPLIHNLIVAVSGDTATANSVMEAQIFGTDHSVMGEYNDSFRRIGGSWYFAARCYTIFSAGSSL